MQLAIEDNILASVAITPTKLQVDGHACRLTATPSFVRFQNHSHSRLYDRNHRNSKIHCHVIECRSIEVQQGCGSLGTAMDLWDSQMKDKTEKEDLDRNRSTDQSYLALRFPFGYFFLITILLPNMLSLAVIVILALTGSFWWTISITTMSRGQILHNYRRLQEQLVSDLWDIGELSLGSSRLQELEFCSEESENYAPCFNVSENLALGYSDGSENTRLCGQSSRQSCLVLPPLNYRIPLRWPTGRDIIWSQMMMMLDEEQISFRSVSPMFDGVEDYSHQIAEMIGLRNESNFVQAGWFGKLIRKSFLNSLSE
ncbi:hypothetical protein NC651_005813 [Populus alba x Populus x berolinensis]|nr:hypothetical protein NC651_005813 [Populus alba x Populus x berolinensis]